MNIRLYNARILTMEPGREVFYGEVWIKNDKIAYVAEQKELAEEWDRSQFPRIAWDIELDCKGNLLMPGFKNAHTHSGMTFLRSMADDMPLDQWLNKQVFPLEAKLTGEDIYDLTRLAVLEYLTSGVTSIFDMYLTPDTIAEACLDTGMRCVLVSGLNNFSSSPKQVEEEFPDQLPAWLPCGIYLLQRTASESVGNGTPLPDTGICPYLRDREGSGRV